MAYAPSLALSPLHKAVGTETPLSFVQRLTSHRPTCDCAVSHRARRAPSNARVARHVATREALAQLSVLDDDHLPIERLLVACNQFIS